MSINIKAVLIAGVISLAISAGLGLKISESSKPVPKTKVISILGPIDKSLVDVVEASLAGLTERDTVLVTIDSPGGDGNTGAKVMKMFVKTPATVVCKVERMAASAAAMILMGCQDKIVPNESLIILHLPYFPTKNPLPVGLIRDGMVNEWFVNLMDSDVCLDVFMGTSDYTKLMLGMDVIYTGKEFNYKLNTVYFRINQILNPLCRNAVV